MHARTIRTTIAMLFLMTSLVTFAPVASAHVIVDLPLNCVFNDNPGAVPWVVEWASGGAVDFHRCSVIVRPEELPDLPPVGVPLPPLVLPPEGLCDDVESLLFEPNC